MKKGFTLIEMLITMVLVAVLTVVALPKYVASLERGRAVQAISVLRDISDTWNTRYVLRTDSPNTYPDGSAVEWDTIRIKKELFDTPVLTKVSGQRAEVYIQRNDGTYGLTAINENGVLSQIQCTSTVDASKYCQEMGAVLKNGVYIIE